MRDSSAHSKETSIRYLAIAFLLVVVVAGVGIAQRSRPRPNLAAAQRYAATALRYLSATEKAGDWDTDGHAEKAKGLLDQANDEFRQAMAAGHKQPQ